MWSHVFTNAEGKTFAFCALQVCLGTLKASQNATFLGGVRNDMEVRWREVCVRHRAEPCFFCSLVYSSPYVMGPLNIPSPSLRFLPLPKSSLSDEASMELV